MKITILKTVCVVAVMCSALLGINCNAQTNTEMQKTIITETDSGRFQARVNQLTGSGWKIVDGSIHTEVSTAFLEGAHYSYVVMMENTNGAPIPVAAPEPSALALCAVGLLSLEFVKRRQ